MQLQTAPNDLHDLCDGDVIRDIVLAVVQQWQIAFKLWGIFPFI